MAKEVIVKNKLQAKGGQATPAPPIGPALGQHGVNIGQFVSQFNDRTRELNGTIVPVVITVYKDKSFTFEVKSPPAAVLLKQAAEIAKGSGWNWVVAWQSGLDYDILFAQTRDEGLSWYAPELVNDYGKSDTASDTEPCIAGDGTGGMVAVWTTGGDPKWTIGTDVDALFSYSKDDGRIWSKAQPLNLTATVDAAADWYPDVAGDGKGTWLAVWYSNNPLGGTGSDYDIFVTRFTLP